MIDVSHWLELTLGERLSGGNRNDVRLGMIGGERVVVRRSRRSTASLDWELDLLEHLDAHGFRVPLIIEAKDRRRSVDGVVVQRWLPGKEPSTEAEWQLVADELVRLHRLFANHPQRPDCAMVTELRAARLSVDADIDSLPDTIAAQILSVFDEFADVETSVIHGDTAPGNIRIDENGTVGLLDWDESRVDIRWHDLSNLGVQVLDDDEHRRASRLSNAWEAANAWVAEPDYAQHRLQLIGRPNPEDRSI